MKKKLLALILGAAMAFGCVFAFAACTDGNGENGGSHGSVVKTTVDNFDEWYQALRDTLTAENYTINTHYIDTSRDMNNIVTGKRQGNVSQFTADEHNYLWTLRQEYREYSGNTVTTYMDEPYKYDSTKSYWYIYTNAYPMHFDNEYLSTLYNNVLYGPFIDEFTLETLSTIYGFPLSADVEITEEGVNASAQSIYAAVVFNEETAEYTYQLEDEYFGEVVFTFKFKNGKISYLNIRNDFNFVEVTHTLTYGDATVTFPEEVKTSAALTKTLNNIASDLEGTYTYEKDNVQHKLKFSFYDFFDYLRSFTGHYETNSSSYFDWEIISTDKIILIFDDDTTAELKIGDNCLIYTDENGKEYTFTKSGQ